MRRRFLLGIVLLASCGDDAPSMKLEEFLAGRDTADCAHLTRCGLFSNESICNAYFRRSDNASLIEGVHSKTVSYDGVAAVKCLAALDLIGCDKTQADLRETPEACAPVFKGRVADGGSCSFSDECKSGVCDEQTCTRDQCCPGTCAATLASPADGPCEADAQCAVGLYCHKTKVCRPRVAANASCDDVRGCDFGLSCIGVTDLQPGTCRKLPLIGESCPYNECAELNASCVAGKCAAVGLPGAGCLQDRDCSSFAECDETAGKCIDTPSLGQTCDVYCAGASWCNNGTCSAPYENAHPCTASSECTSTYCREGVVFDECAPVATCI